MATQTETLDCSDIDQHLGKPIESSPLREPIGNNDIRRWAHAMHYANLLHFDPDYAAASRWGRIVAPQSFPIVMDDGHGTAPSCVGCIPDTHLLFGGDEFWHYGPRIFGGEIITNERIPFDYVVKNTGFGPTCFQRGDNFYRNQNGVLIALPLMWLGRKRVLGWVGAALPVAAAAGVELYFWARSDPARAPLPMSSRSITNSLTIRSVSRPAPTSQMVRSSRRLATVISAPAVMPQRIDTAVCTTEDSASAAKSNGTCM